ncbi:antitoxin of toxin-antitoxin stability system [Serratia marcescens]
MSKIISTTVYTLDELSATAREQARAWYREHALNDDGYQTVYDDFRDICNILGVEIKMYRAPLPSSGHHQPPCIWFSGFCHQGDGACFEGDYVYQPQAVYRIREHFPEDAELHRIADLLLAIQMNNGGQLRATIRHRGQYVHENGMTITVERYSPSGQDMTSDSEVAISEALRDLARWLYDWLESEHSWQTSPTIIDEDIINNEYTFTGSGQRFG